MRFVADVAACDAYGEPAPPSTPIRGLRGTDWPGRPLPRMRRLRYQRPRLGIGLIMALAVGTVAGVFGYYGVLVWRFFFD